MKRQRLSARASAAVILMAAALAPGGVDSHGAKTKESAVAPPSENKVEQSAPSEITGPAMMMPDGRTGGLLMPMMDPARGRKMFAAKGCVVCHAINGVGGDHGPKLDMSRVGPMNPFEFAAKMWRGAEAMAVLQREELGETIELTGQDLADIIAFVHSPKEIRRFSEADLPHKILDVFKRTHGKDTGHPHKDGSTGPHKN